MSDKKQHDDAGDKRRSGERENAPDWANGLRQLYDSVVEEPLPDSFRDLLEQFDERDHKEQEQHAKTPPHGRSGS